jgi:hypothetical protein
LAFTPTLTEHESFRWFDWNPPHEIQAQTIDPLLDAVAKYIAQSPTGKGPTGTRQHP